jgi:hypothetical protein
VVSVDALRGFVLEELLARLLYDNGYRLLVSEQQDPDALKSGAHGLLVRGRGTDHQADVLGELKLPIPFSLPLRIFVEAKYRGVKASLRDVRNGHGVVHDVNEQYATATAGARSVPMRRHHYRYTLFSAAGFTRPAQQYALAQQVSLVDLSSPAFAGLLDSANQAALELHRLAQEVRISPFPRGQMRTALRLALDTWTADELNAPDSGDVLGTPMHRARHAAERNPARREPHRLPAEPLARVAMNLADRARGDLLLGSPAAPFVLALSPDEPAALSEYVIRHGSEVEVNIEFATRREVTGDWVIVPADGSRRFQLRFALPALLEDWLLGDGATALRARDVKADLLSSIAVIQHDRLINLVFQPRRRT